MGVQIRTDNLPYKILIPVFRFYSGQGINDETDRGL